MYILRKLIKVSEDEVFKVNIKREISIQILSLMPSNDQHNINSFQLPVEQNSMNTMFNFFLHEMLLGRIGKRKEYVTVIDLDVVPKCIK